MSKPVPPKNLPSRDELEQRIRNYTKCGWSPAEALAKIAWDIGISSEEAKTIIDSKINNNLEKENQPPPLLRLEKNGLVVYPRMEKRPDGEWRIKNPELFKSMLGSGEDETQKVRGERGNREAQRFLRYLFGLGIMIAVGGWLLNLLWPPLIILLLLICSGSLCIEVKKSEFLFSKIAPILACVWGALIALITHFGCLYTQSPLWFSILTYVSGLFAAGYIGYRDQQTVIAMEISSIKDYHVLCQILSILVYLSLLLCLYLVY